MPVNTISIIIPTLNAAGHILGLIESLNAQSVKPDEILVVDSSSDDDTAAISRQLGAKVIEIQREDFNHGSTRNLAARAALGNMLVFMTQDALPADNEALKNLLLPFESDSGMGAAYGRQLPALDASAFASHLRKFNYPEDSYVRTFKDRSLYGLKVAFISNSFAAYRKDALQNAGWFKEGLIMGEDTCVAARMLMMGSRIAYASDACVVHSHNYTVFEDFRRYFDTGVFHSKEGWLRENFGRAEGEGLRYVKSEFSFLRDRGELVKLLPEFVIRNLLKYLGYKTGTSYKLVPGSLTRKLSMHPGWWKKAG